MRNFFKKFYFFKLFRMYINYLIIFIFHKFKCLKKNSIFKEIKFLYDLIKYKDHTRSFVALTPFNLVNTIKRRFQKGLELIKF